MSNIANRRWPFITIGVGFVILAFLHLVAWVFIVFIYHANAIPKTAREYLPLYGLLGTSGVWLFLITIILDLISGVLFSTSQRRGRPMVFLTAVVNLPIIPLGPIVGAAALFVLFASRREPRDKAEQ